LIIHDQIHILGIEFNKIIQEKGKERNYVKSHTIEVLENEINSVMRLNSSDKFLITFYNTSVIQIYKILQNKNNEIKQIKKVTQIFFI